MIQAEGLTKAFRSQAVLRGMTFEVRPGEITLMVGPNGAGKSTTMKVLAGLVRPDAGVARIGGDAIGGDRRAAQRRLSFLPQTPNFHPRFTCLQILRFYARLRGVAPSRVTGVLESAGLGEAANVPTRALSGGMRQRLGLAVLMLPDAGVLLLDEPGLSLDPDWRARLQQLLRDEAGGGKTVLVTTHLLAEWNGAADRCLLCREGRIDREIDPDGLAAAFPSPPASPARRSFPEEPHALCPIPA